MIWSRTGSLMTRPPMDIHILPKTRQLLGKLSLCLLNEPKPSLTDALRATFANCWICLDRERSLAEMLPVSQQVLDRMKIVRSPSASHLPGTCQNLGRRLTHEIEVRLHLVDRESWME